MWASCSGRRFAVRLTLNLRVLVAMQTVLFHICPGTSLRCVSRAQSRDACWGEGCSISLAKRACCCACDSLTGSPQSLSGMGGSGVSRTDEELEGPGSQDRPQNGMGRGLAVEGDRHAGIGLRFFQWPIIMGEELGQRLLLDAQQSE